MASPTYKMRGMDATIHGLYDTWIVTGSPDTTGASYTGPLATPLRDIVVVDSWGVNVTGMSGLLADPQKIEVAKVGVLAGTRKRLNLIEGPGASLTVADNPGNNSVDLTVAATGAAAAARSALSYIGLLTGPASPDSWNDEFEGGSPDLAERGWSIFGNGAGGVIWTRQGPVDPNSLPPAGQYRSSIVGTKLLIQVASTVFISKPVSGSCAFAARINLLGQSDAGSPPIGVGISTIQTHTNGANKFMMGWQQGNQAKLLEYNAGTYTNRGTVATITAVQGFDIQWITYTFAGTTMNSVTLRHIASHSGAMSVSTWATPFTGFATQHGGVLLSGITVPSWYEVDYIRRYPEGSFFPP